MPKGLDKACTAGITESMGHLFNAEIRMDEQFRCLDHPAAFQIRTNGYSITKEKTEFEFLLIEEYFFAQRMDREILFRVVGNDLFGRQDCLIVHEGERNFPLA